MVQLTEGPDKKVVAFQLGGKITTEELNTVTNAIAKRIAARGRICLYCEVDDDVEYNADLSLADLGYSSRHLENFDRVAVVSDRNWLTELSHLTDDLPETEVKHFERAHKEQATAWVCE